MRHVYAWLARLLPTGDDPIIDTLIVPPVPKFAGHNDNLRVRTEARRRIADAIRSRAKKVESGSRVADLLRMVKRA